MCRGVEHGRMPVRVRERLGQRAAGQAVDLFEHAARGLDVQLVVRGRAEQLLPVQHLEQVELDVAEVALEVRHLPSSQLRPPSARSRLPESNLLYYRSVTAQLIELFREAVNRSTVSASA